MAPAWHDVGTGGTLPSDGDGSELAPPGESSLTPDYWDFLYYAFVIGMCYQTSDVSVVRADLRRYTLLHSVFAYLYGVGILSMLISAVGGAF